MFMHISQKLAVVGLPPERRIMRKITWKIVYKIVCSWEKVARKNEISEQIHYCMRMRRYLELYKEKAQLKGMW